MVGQAARDIGGVDIVVNNAGIRPVAPVEVVSGEKWDAVIAINLSAAFHAIRAALPHMKAPAGTDLNIASTHGWWPRRRRRPTSRRSTASSG